MGFVTRNVKCWRHPLIQSSPPALYSHGVAAKHVHTIPTAIVRWSSGTCRSSNSRVGPCGDMAASLTLGLMFVGSLVGLR